MTVESLHDYKKRYTVTAVFKRRYLLDSGGFNWLSLCRDIVLVAFVVFMTSLAGLAWLVLPLHIGFILAGASWFLTAVYVHYYYAGIERLLLQIPGISEKGGLRMVVVIRLLSACLFFFLLSAAMHAAAIAYISGLHFSLSSLPPYDRLPFLGILSITYLSLMFCLSSFRVRMKPAPRLKQVVKLIGLTLLLCGCSIMGGYLFDPYHAVYVLLAAYFVPFIYILATLSLSLVVNSANRRSAPANTLVG